MPVTAEDAGKVRGRPIEEYINSDAYGNTDTQADVLNRAGATRVQSCLGGRVWEGR